MPGGGGNPHRAPRPSSSAHSHHRKSRWESTSSAAAAAATTPDSKSAAAHKSNSSKSKPSPNNNPNATPQNNKRPIPTKPNDPSPNPANPISVSEARPIFPFAEPPPPPSYGFHMLERRTIFLADGSVRSYFALPPDYQNIPLIPRHGFRPEFRGPHAFVLDKHSFPMSPEFLGPDARARNPEHWNLGPESTLKRKFGEEERGGRTDGFERQRQQLLQYGNANAHMNMPGPSAVHDLGRGEEERAPKNMRLAHGSGGKLKHSEVDQDALNKAFLHFVKLVYEATQQRKKYLADGKQGSMWCVPCGRSSKDFPDTHNLIMHAYNDDNAESIVNHLGFHKAICILMGWNYSVPPDNTKVYQNLSADDAEANKYDLIMWPPTVLIHNTITGKSRDGRIEGIGNRTMDNYLRDLGFPTGKSMSLHMRSGFLGLHAVKFSAGESGLKDALKMADYFEKEKRGRKDWARVQPETLGQDDENDPNLVKFDPVSREKKRVYYGHLGTVCDLEKVNYDIRKRVSIISMKEFFTNKSSH